MAGYTKNRVELIGRLGQDPKRGPNQNSPVNITVATNYRAKDRQSGEMKDETQWTNCVLFGRQADTAMEYLKKGSYVNIEGRLQTRKWTDNNGQDRYTTEVLVSNMGMLDSRNTQGNGSQKPHTESNQAAANNQQAPYSDDDMPDFESDELGF